MNNSSEEQEIFEIEQTENFDSTLEDLILKMNENLEKNNELLENINKADDPLLNDVLEENKTTNELLQNYIDFENEKLEEEKLKEEEDLLTAEDPEEEVNILEFLENREVTTYSEELQVIADNQDLQIEVLNNINNNIVLFLGLSIGLVVSITFLKKVLDI